MAPSSASFACQQTARHVDQIVYQAKSANGASKAARVPESVHGPSATEFQGVVTLAEKAW